MLKDFKALKLSLASPQQIMNWSNGEVRKAETINYRTHKAEVDGLMDEKIFGPTKNYECYCGKYKKIRYKGIICDKCGVEVTHKRVRRERLGHIKLASPVTHIWYAYGVPNKLSLVLNIPQKKLETVIYFSRYLVTKFDEIGREQAVKSLEEQKDKATNEITAEQQEQLKTLESKSQDAKKGLKKTSGKSDKLELQLDRLESTERKELAKLKSIFDQRLETVEQKFEKQVDMVEDIHVGMALTEEEYADLLDSGVEFFEAGMGAEAILQLLEKVDVPVEIEKLKIERTQTKSVLKIRRIIQRLRLLEGMAKNGIEPKWMVLNFLPVLPPDLRPIIQLPGGRFATSDLNDLYRRVINRNNRLKRLMDLGAPEIILRNEKRMLQEAVDALIDNSHRPGNAVQNSRAQPYKSLSDMLRGKQGRFRQNLLGKRVDFSGRSVIVAGPDLSITQCGLPKIMALELFKPFVMHEIIAQGLAANIKSAKNFFEEKSDVVWDILEKVIENRPVLLNRAPTLHKQGIQAFYPVLVEGDAIRLHPLVCKGFNADFDGDQMAVHVPLAEKAVEEVKRRMFSGSNILLMADGKPVINANKDMAFGIYYLTEAEPKSDHIRTFSSPHRAIGAYNNADIKLREVVIVLKDDEILETTAGRLIFNQSLPIGYPYINEQLNRSGVSKISSNILKKYDGDEAVKFLNQIEQLGFKFATASGFSIGIEDFVINPEKDKMLKGIEDKEQELLNYYNDGLVTYQERRRLFETMWLKLVSDVSAATWQEYKNQNNSLVKLNDSGALPVEDPLNQISGVRGLIVDPLGQIVELPLRSNYKQGLSSLEYFVAARGTRKALADVALKTAESGYLTRKLVDVAQDVITRIEDCNTDLGVHLSKSDDRRVDFVDRITGRWLARDIHSEKNGELILAKNGEITIEIAERIANDDSIKFIFARSVLSCEAEKGVCAKCYGYDLGTKQKVKLGMAVGVIAAQAMGEASTQLTLGAKHRHGSASAKDITQGLPRVEELFEVRTPKLKGILAEIEGQVKIAVDEVMGITTIVLSNKHLSRKEYDTLGAKEIAINKIKKVKEGVLLFIDKDGVEIIAEFNGQARPVEDNKIVLEAIVDEEFTYEVNSWAQLLVKDGATVTKGQQLTQGSIDPKELMSLKGLLSAQEYIINNIQETYGNQGIAIDDKHVEIAVRQMSRFVTIVRSGASEYLPGDYVDHLNVKSMNRTLRGDNKDTIKSLRQLMGLSNASLRTESFLSAASFQDQVRVLTDASVLGKIDVLSGLKENVIIGRTVPLGEEVR